MPIVAGEKMLSPEEKAHLHSLWFVKKEHRGERGGLDMSALSKLSKPEKAYVIEEYKKEDLIKKVYQLMERVKRSDIPDVTHTKDERHDLRFHKWDLYVDPILKNPKAGDFPIEVKRGDLTAEFTILSPSSHDKTQHVTVAVYYSDERRDYRKVTEEKAEADVLHVLKSGK